MSKTKEVSAINKPSEFFKRLDLSKLDVNTAEYIRTELLSFDNTDLLEGTPEFEAVKEMIEENFPQALGIIPVPDKDIEDKKKITPEPVKKTITGKVNKKEQKRLEQEEKKAAKEKHQQEIISTQESIEMYQEVFDANPNDNDAKESLEMYKEVLADLKKKKFEEGGGLDNDDNDNDDIKLKYIGELIKNGNTSGYDPNWTLKIDFDGEIDDSDREHIAKLVADGYTSGEIVSGEESQRGWWSIVIGEEMRHGGEVGNEEISVTGLKGTLYFRKGMLEGEYTVSFLPKHGYKDWEVNSVQKELLSKIKKLFKEGKLTEQKVKDIADNVYAKGGEVNGRYLDTISDDKKSKILNNIANHYGISVADAEQEVKDADAEMLYEYIANDNSLRMSVYNDFKINKYAKGGGVKNDTLSPSESSKPVFFKPHEFNPLNTPVKYEVIDENGNVVLKTTSFNKAVDKRTSNYIFSKKEQTSRLKIVATDKNGFSKEIAEGVNSKGEIFSNGGGVSELLAIIERKKKGIDNTEEESAEIKGFIKEVIESGGDKSKLDEIIKYFPIEYDEAITERLEYLRGELRAERISQGELIELQSLAKHIDPSDVELLEAAGVPEFADDENEYEGKYIYKFHEERGELSAYVENMATGEEVWSFKYPDYSLPEEEREFQSTPVNDGFIRHWEDINGIENYLKDLAVIPSDGQLLSESEANKLGFYKQGGFMGRWFSRKPKERQASEYEVAVTRKDGSTDNPIFSSQQSAEGYKADMERLGHTATVKPIFKTGGSIGEEITTPKGRKFTYTKRDNLHHYSWENMPQEYFSVIGKGGVSKSKLDVEALDNMADEKAKNYLQFKDEKLNNGGGIDDHYVQVNDLYVDKKTFKVTTREGVEKYKGTSLEDATNWANEQYKKSGGAVATATEVDFAIGDILQNKQHPHIYVTLIVSRKSGGSGQLFTAYESDKNGKAVTEGNWVRAVWDWDFKDWNKVGHVNLKQVEKKYDDATYSYYKSGNKQIDTYLSLFDDRYQFFVNNAPKPLKNLRDKLEADNHHYATATVVSDFFNDPKKNKVTQYKFKKGGKIEKAFIQKVKEIHNQIKEVTLKDGTKIDGKDLMADGGALKNKERVEVVLKHYLIAALWSSTDSENEDTPFDTDYSVDDFDKKTVDKVRALIIKFMMDNETDLKRSGLDDEQIGHDLWLTQVGHGAGFWDRGLDKELGERLSNEAKKLGQSANLYAEKGKVYIDGLNNPDEMAKGGGVGNSKPEHYRYLTLQKVKGGLQVSLNKDGIEEVKDLKSDGKSDSDIWFNLFEDVHGNSEYIFHSDMGESGFGLTSAEGITDGFYYEGEDRSNLYKTNYPESAKVYWFPNYMITSPLDKMIEEGKVVFTEAESMKRGGKVSKNKSSDEDKLREELSEKIQYYKNGLPPRGHKYGLRWKGKTYTSNDVDFIIEEVLKAEKPSKNKMNEGGSMEGWTDLSNIVPAKLKVEETTAFGNPEYLNVMYNGKKIAKFYYNMRGYNPDFSLKNKEGVHYGFGGDKSKSRQFSDFKSALREGFVFIK